MFEQVGVKASLPYNYVNYKSGFIYLFNSDRDLSKIVTGN